METPAAFYELCRLSKQCAILESIDSLLGWDERTMIPANGGSYRAEQMKTMAGLIHQQRTSPRWTELLDELAASDWQPPLGSDAAGTIRQVRRAVERARKLPQALVEALAEATVTGQQVWSQAKREQNFERFAPQLQRIIELKREQAAAIGFQETLYDALLDEYEPGAKTADLQTVLHELKDQLVPLIRRVAESKLRQPQALALPDVGLLRGKFPVQNQRSLATKAASAIGFDFNRGRLDVTDHPFCSEMGPDDCRITTRYDEFFFNTAFFGVLHEAGHALYEQGLRSDQYGLPPGRYCSLGIHESQSRLWENCVGRSRGFWEFLFHSAQSEFPAALGKVSLSDFYAAINSVQPSLIRVEADEATYNLHVIVRFELEQMLLSGDLPVRDLPEQWNLKYEQALGVTPANDAEGCLQDVHWSAGLFGYFPTYSLGNLYAAQLFEKAGKDLGDFEQMFANGEFDLLKRWLTEKIYRHGQNFAAADLVQQVTGEPLSSRPLLKYLEAKLRPLYGV